jgi:hypothetical protein
MPLNSKFAASHQAIDNPADGRPTRWMEHFKLQVDIGYRKFWAKRGVDATKLGRDVFKQPTPAVGNE